jgi:hypothetical protein
MSERLFYFVERFTESNFASNCKKTGALIKARLLDRILPAKHLPDFSHFCAYARLTSSWKLDSVFVTLTE